MLNNESRSAIFAALSDPTRRAILDRLAEGETTVMELARPFAISQPAISRHLKVLEDAGLITRRVDGSRRPCRLAGAPLAEIEAWLTQLRTALETNYARLDDVLAEMQAASTEAPDQET
ncbi:MAG: metalloregulator ArsR/SmtB family transcription factor [Paracoccaceae bacterium]